MTRVTRFVIAALVLASCSTGTAEPPPSTSTSTAPSTTTTVAPTTTTTDPYASCIREDGRFAGTIDGSDLVAASIAISRAGFDCAPVVGLAPHDDPDALIEAARFIDGSGPILAVDGPLHSDTLDEISRLGPKEVVTFGLEGVRLEGVTVVPAASSAPGSASGLPNSGGEGGQLLVASSPELSALAWAAAQATGNPFLAISGDLFEAEQRTIDAIRSATAVSLIAPSDSPLEWQVSAIRAGIELPGGGHTVFSGKRLVALYGNPTTPFLGVLGEQGPEEGLERLQTIAEGYGDDGLTVVPTFEIIATVASARAGADNDYSDEMSVDTLRPWVEFAAENGVYVVLDLQPGRTDFLTQAKYFEELLRLPHVGLALDPEWRLKPNQVHLRQIGSVDAAEINAVGEWLAGIVREESLPQKLFLVHQFKFSMITNRDAIELHPELSFVIQMDGQGPLPTKYDTFAAITAGTADTGWLWGWKNFFDEDTPTAGPEQVLDLDPVVVFVSFQ